MKGRGGDWPSDNPQGGQGLGKGSAILEIRNSKQIRMMETWNEWACDHRFSRLSDFLNLFRISDFEFSCTRSSPALQYPRGRCIAALVENIPCRQCSKLVSAATAVCPHCGAPKPAVREWKGEGYEWKSAGRWMGEPVVHVAFGNGADGRPRTARGVIAIGQRAVGGMAVGIVAAGLVCFAGAVFS